MVTAIKESKRQDKQQNQIKTISITYDQNSKSIHFFYLRRKPKQHQIKCKFKYQ